jgi:hypothetical protein
LAQSGKLADVFKRWHIPYELPQKPAELSRGTTGK